MPRSTKPCVLILILVFLGSVSAIYGQKRNNQKLRFYKNLIYANVGSVGLSGSLTGYYERMLGQRRKFASFIKVGAGVHAYWGGESRYILAQCGILTGLKKHHLELGAGPGYLINLDKDETLSITATVGWRYQKPGKKFMFRMGFSFPEGIHMGVGFSF